MWENIWRKDGTPLPLPFSLDKKMLYKDLLSTSSCTSTVVCQSLLNAIIFAFTAQILLAQHHEGHLACKNPAPAIQ